ncbi:MAG: tetratricopeptide repeat protein, partial [Elusimicrobiales bacterium]|nr:tetratricopeptide repeat protein [Elusimicrobiales bacterium]
MIKTEILAENKNLHKLEKLFSCRNLTPSHYGELIEILLKNNLIVLAEKAILLGLKKFNSGKKLSQYIRAVIFQREMDTFFSCKMDALDFKVAVSDIFYRLAELHCQFGNTKKMEFFFKKFSSLETARQKPHQTLNAFCALGEFEKILNLKLMKNYPFKAEEIHDSLNPFEKIIDARHLRFLQKKLNLTSREKPGEPELKFLKALLIKKVSPKKSAEMLSKIKTSNAKLNAIARYHAGQFFLNSVNFKKAHANFQKAFKVFPECETLTGKISECLMGMGSVKKALANIQKLIKKRPSPGLISWRGELLLLSGKYIEAKTILAKATKENRGMSYCWLGAALFKLGKINKALENLNKAVEINPDDLEALIWRAEANIKLNNFEKALRDINKARELDNKFLWVYLNTARICLVKKEFKKAIVEFKKVPLYARKFLIKKS